MLVLWLLEFHIMQACLSACHPMDSCMIHLMILDHI
jgi:hypothetical protein